MSTQFRDLFGFLVGGRHGDCVLGGTVDGSYRYPDVASSDVLGVERDRHDRQHAEHPLALDDHAMDALRYAVMGLKQAIPNAPVAKPIGW